LAHALATQATLVTLDHDFGQVLRFPPDKIAGVIVLETPGRLSAKAITSRIAEMAGLLRTRGIDRELWIVEPGRIRIREKRGQN
jgi:hypothetical protein